MNRLSTLLLGTLAPSQRFPALWAWANRPGRLQRLLAEDAALEAAVVAVINDCARLAARLLVRAAHRLEEELASYTPRRDDAPLVGGLAAATAVSLVIAVAGAFGSNQPVSPVMAAPASAVSTAVAPQAADPATALATEATATPAVDGTEPPAVAPAVAPAEAAVAPGLRGALPIGKGMWLYVPEHVEGGNAEAIVSKAKGVGLTHLYVRTGSSRMGFYAQDFLNRLLPVAHANGIRVYGWDFPYFYSWSEDVFRAVEAINYTTPDGHRIDGFSADIETESEGTVISSHHAAEYGAALRRYVGPDYPLIATVPRPSPTRLAGTFPYADLAANFDAFAPMLYWMNRDPAAEATYAMQVLAPFGRPVIPVGQAYDGGPEGGPPGVPSAESIIRFMQAAEASGAIGVSFWSWQHADAQAWEAIRAAAEFHLAPGSPEQLTRGMVIAYQAQLAQLGFAPAGVTGVWDQSTADALRDYQNAVGLPATGIMDDATFRAFLRPFAAPIRPAG